MKLHVLAATLLIAGNAAAADYATIVLEKDLNVPAEAAWKKIGPFCSLSQWLNTTCEITSGAKGFGDIGSVRHVAGRVNEVMVGKTSLSYTYTFDNAKDLYHGTVEVVPKGTGASKIVYTLFYDAEPLGSAEAKKADRENRSKRFSAGLDVMKTMAEAK